MRKTRGLFWVVWMIFLFLLTGCKAKLPTAANHMEIKQVDIKSSIKTEDSASYFLGANGVELNYADESRIVFHSHAGLFLCEKEGDNWQLTHTVDLAALEANMTQGDSASLIYADRDEVLIMPKRYAPDNDNPITYRYHITENSLEKTEGFSEQNDSALIRSYSEEGTKLMQQMYEKMQQKHVSLSNLYPVGGPESGMYGFVAVRYDDANTLQALQYGCYHSDTDTLEMQEILIP